MEVTDVAERTLAQNVAQAINDFKAIKEALETHGSDDNLDGVPTSEYAGYVEGVAATAHSAGYEDRRAEFWEMYQNSGERVQYDTGFAGVSWNEETFQPMYDIYPTSAYMMFRYFGTQNKPFDLQEHLDGLGITLDFSNCTNIYLAFMGTRFTRVGEINCTKATNTRTLFNASSYLKTIDKLILNNNGTNEMQQIFQSCKSLENVTFEGVIGESLDVGMATKLTKASLDSIISVLKDFSRTSTTATLTLHADSKAKLSEADIAIATQKGWTVA